MKNGEADKLIYQIFPRNYSEEGTLKAVTQDLDRLKNLGVDILYLMPVQPIGKVGRKGTWGSPYAISDFTAINPDLGTWDDLAELAQAAHQRGMRLIVDQVFNHTSRDSVLIASHPDFYWHDREGHLGNKAGDWSDVYDLDHTNPALEEYLIGVLDKFLAHGIDGFRFDVASLIPTSFFRSFTAFAKEKYPDRGLIMLAECIDTPFILATRKDGFNADSNSELYDAGFNLFYCYGSFAWFHDYITDFDERKLWAYRAALTMEEANLPARGCAVVRNLENHDQPRLASYSTCEHLRRNLLTFTFFTKGPGWLYAGEEVGCDHLPNLFEKDPVDFAQPEAEAWLAFTRKLIALKRREHNLHLITTTFPQSEGLTLVCINHFDDGHREVGIFNLSEQPQPLPRGLLEGHEAKDLLTGQTVDVDQLPATFTEPLWLEF